MDEHIDQTELALFALEPDRLPPDRRAAVHRHIAACAACQAGVDFFAVAEEELREPDVWEPSLGSATLDSLRAYAEQIAAEDEEAEALLEPLFQSPAAVALTNIKTLGKRFMTGGVVRRLNAHAHGICESEPLDALTFADVAVTIAEALLEDTYPANALYELRGTAWKERANAQMVLGDFPGALDSLRRAERAYTRLPVPGLGLAIVALIRAGVLYEQRNLQEAAAMAEAAEIGFMHLGDDDRRVRALHLRGSINLEAGDVDTALRLYNRVLEYGESTEDTRWIARASYAIGQCECDRGNLGEASMAFHKALVVFRELGPVGDRLATEWGLARVVVQGGKVHEGIRRLRLVATEFEQRGMLYDAALVGLDVADALLSLGETQSIVELGARLFQSFRNADVVTGALTAVAYMKEAAAQGKLTSQGVAAVRKYLRSAERQPELLFIPPPGNPC